MVSIFKRFINWILSFFSKKRSKEEYKEIIAITKERPAKERETTIKKETPEKKSHIKRGKKEQKDISHESETKFAKEEETKVNEEKTVPIEPKSDTKIETSYKEEITKNTEDQVTEEKKRQIPRKPRIKKSPTEQRKKHETTIRKEKKTHRAKEKEVDLGRTKKTTTTKHVSSAKELLPKTQDESKKSEKPSLSLPHILSPYIEINFDEAKVFLVLPKQILPINTSVNISSQNKFEYRLKINSEEKRITAKVSKNEKTIEIEEKRIELKEPLHNFEVNFPKEISGKTYKYKHKDNMFYIFLPSGNSGKMYYLYDETGTVNPLPKRNVWILLHEDFELLIEPDIIEERWIWENYQPLNINLKESNELIIKNRKTGTEKRISCEPTFIFDTNNAIFDDFGEISPIFTENSLKINAPNKNSSGWAVWIQNKRAGSKLVKNDWTGDEPLVLNLPDDLPCEWGEFQIDICEQKGEPITTLFFRYVPSLQLKYTKELIFPNPEKGHDKEHIEIILENSEDFELNTNYRVVDAQKGFRILVPPENDTVRLSISQKNMPETMVNLQITLPRLKWRTSKQEFWGSKPIQIKREDLILGEDFYLFVRSNSLSKYNLSIVLESNGKKLQEAKFVRKGVDYTFLLNQFYDTIKKNKKRLKLQIIIEKDGLVVGKIPIAFIHEIKSIHKKPERVDKKINLVPLVKAGKGIRKGKGFSKGELLKAGIEIGYVRRLNISYDKRRKTIHQHNIEKLKALLGVNINGDRSN